MLVIAFMVGVTLAGKRAEEEGVASEAIFNLCFLAFISGIIGARLLYLLQHAAFYIRNPKEIVMLQHGGLSWFGGLIFGSVCACLYIRRKKLAPYKILDIIAPFLALAQAIGRAGCLLNGCCYGLESSFGIYFPVHNAVLIPTQIYSSFLLLLIYLVLRFLQERPHTQGKIFFTYLLLYSLKRFFIEFWRADNPAFVWGLTLFQIMSIALFVVALVKLFLLCRNTQ
jgi:phosphatidylglycerol:prolipoprotein diacylglycerol transferase